MGVAGTGGGKVRAAAGGMTAGALVAQASRPLALVPDSRLHAMRERWAALLQGWQEDWGLGTALVDCRRAWEGETPPRESWLKLAGGLWLHVPGQWAAALRAQLWHETVANSDSIAYQTGQQAMDDLQARMVQASVAAPAAPPVAPAADGVGRFAMPATAAPAGPKTTAAAVPAVFADPLPASVSACLAWASGAMLVGVSLGGQTLEWLIADPASWLGAPPPAKLALPPLEPRSRALGKQAVTLQVEAGRAQVLLGQLLTLAVGDVVRLDHSIDAPLPVYAPQGEHVFDGYPGKLDETMALEVVARSLTGK